MAQQLVADDPGDAVGTQEDRELVGGDRSAASAIQAQIRVSDGPTQASDIGIVAGTDGDLGHADMVPGDALDVLSAVQVHARAAGMGDEELPFAVADGGNRGRHAAQRRIGRGDGQHAAIRFVGNAVEGFVGILGLGDRLRPPVGHRGHGQSCGEIPAPGTSDAVDDHPKKAVVAALFGAKPEEPVFVDLAYDPRVGANPMIEIERHYRFPCRCGEPNHRSAGRESPARGARNRGAAGRESPVEHARCHRIAISRSAG